MLPKGRGARILCPNKQIGMIADLPQMNKDVLKRGFIGIGKRVLINNDVLIHICLLFGHSHKQLDLLLFW